MTGKDVNEIYRLLSEGDSEVEELFSGTGRKEEAKAEKSVPPLTASAAPSRVSAHSPSATEEKPEKNVRISPAFVPPSVEPVEKQEEHEKDVATPSSSDSDTKDIGTHAKATENMGKAPEEKREAAVAVPGGMREAMKNVDADALEKTDTGKSADAVHPREKDKERDGKEISSQGHIQFSHAEKDEEAVKRVPDGKIEKDVSAANIESGHERKDKQNEPPKTRTDEPKRTTETALPGAQSARNPYKKDAREDVKGDVSVNQEVAATPKRSSWKVVFDDERNSVSVRTSSLDLNLLRTGKNTMKENGSEMTVDESGILFRPAGEERGEWRVKLDRKTDYVSVDTEELSLSLLRGGRNSVSLRGVSFTLDGDEIVFSS